MIEAVLMFFSCAAVYEFETINIAAMAIFAVSALCGLFVFLIERKRKPDKVDNDVKIPEGAVKKKVLG